MQSNNEEFELKEQYETDENVGDTIMGEIISEYVSRIKDINKEHKNGVPIEKQTKIGELISDGKRAEDESFQDYKLRQKAEKLIIKHYRKGVRGR